MTRYRITIEATDIEEVISGKEWERGVVPGKEGDPDGYGYTPEIVKKREVTRTIYEQVLDRLALSDVIKAFNQID